MRVGVGVVVGVEVRAALRVLLVLDDDGVGVERLGVHAARVVLVGEVEADRVGQVDVDLVREAVLLPLAAQQPLPGQGQGQG